MLDKFKNQITELNKIGIALSSTQNLDELLDIIVTESRRFTNAEGGSLYIKDGEHLKFLISQNKTLDARLGDEKSKALFKPFDIPISKRSISGYVAFTGEVVNIDDVYEMSPLAEYGFNKDFDLRNDYRTKSMLTVPMKEPNGNIIGVLQLINANDEAKEVIPFSQDNQDLILSLASQAAVCIKNAQLTARLKQAHLDTIFRLAVAAEYRDQDTAMHIRRISGYSVIIAKQLNLPPSEIELIEYASPMHDIGKIGVPDAILLKPGRLTPEERIVMETHSAIGAKILADSDSEVLQASEVVALSHHEKFDGSGYPNKIKGEDIHLWGRIVALTDVFDALSSKRCYKPAFPMEKVMSIIEEERGKHFDPVIVDAFLEGLPNIMTIKQSYQEELEEESCPPESYTSQL
jgi:putative two-component system response regulator